MQRGAAPGDWAALSMPGYRRRLRCSRLADHSSKKPTASSKQVFHSLGGLLQVRAIAATAMMMASQEGITVTCVSGEKGGSTAVDIFSSRGMGADMLRWKYEPEEGNPSDPHRLLGFAG